MTVQNQGIGWSQESKLLQYILKQLNRLVNLIGNISNGGNVDGLLVGDGAGGIAPAVSGTDIKTVGGETLLGSGNVSFPGGFQCADVPACETDPVFSAWIIATPPAYPADIPVNVSELNNDVGYGIVLVSQTDPLNPTDGLLWYKPDLCTTTTTTTMDPNTPFFMMKFDSLDNADLMIGGDSADVGDWNTFFDLPTNGTAFDNIALDGVAMTVTLYGGGNMTLSAYLFGDNDPSGTSLLEVEDNGVTVACEDGVFSDWGNIGVGCKGLYSTILLGCTTVNDLLFANSFGSSSLLTAHLPICINLGDKVFMNCDLLNDLILPFDSYTSLGESVFDYCIVLPQQDFPNLLSAGKYCFNSLYLWTNPNFDSLQVAGECCFNYCTGLTSPNFDSLQVAGECCFTHCTGLTSLGLPVCTDLGGTTGNTNVFTLITGKTITITIPHALESDGDIVYLKANNTVTVLYSD